jgi:hypothetical protein
MDDRPFAEQKKDKINPVVLHFRRTDFVVFLMTLFFSDFSAAWITVP